MVTGMLVWMLETSESQFSNTLSIFEESDSGWKPDETSLSVAQQVAHVAQANEWFVHGITSGFDAPFESSRAGDASAVLSYSSLREARVWLDESFHRIRDLIDRVDVGWGDDFPEKPRFCAKPRWSALVGLVDHCAHHRGMLQVYARCMGKSNAPSLPYL